MTRSWMMIGALALSSVGAPASANMDAALKGAAKSGKHLFALFVRRGDSDSAKMKSVFASAGRALGKRATMHVADVSDQSEAAIVRRYGIDRAPLPLTLVFAPNGAMVKAFPGKVVSKAELTTAFASPALAQVLKAMQGGKLVLLCVAGKRPRDNAKSLAAARAAAADKRAPRGAIEVVSVNPNDGSSADVLRPIKAELRSRESSVYILVPPSTIAGKVTGATSKDAVWAAITKGIAACSGGSCCPK